MSDDTHFVVRYADARELVQADERELRHGGCLVPGTQTPSLFSRVSVQFHLPDGPSVEVHGTVVNATSAGFFVQFEKGIEYEALRSAVDFVCEVSGVLDISAMEQEPELPAAPDPETALPEVEADAEAGASEPDRPDALAGNIRAVWDMIDPGSPIPLHKQISELSTPEKVRLARHATKPIREILIRDNDGRVHVEVIKNPKVTQMEILEYTRIPRLSPDALRWVASQKRHMRSPMLVVNLVSNPQTPMDLAARLVLTLPEKELMRVSRNGNIREPVTRAAKKKLMQSGVI